MNTRKAGTTGAICTTLIAAMLTAACDTREETGTVINKTQRVEAECTKYAKYRAGEARRCITYTDTTHWYLIVQLDGAGDGATKTVEVPVDINTYNETAIGSRYAE